MIDVMSSVQWLIRKIERLRVLWLHFKLAIQLLRAAKAIRAWNKTRIE
jgi:hypothetical protein